MGIVFVSIVGAITGLLCGIASMGMFKYLREKRSRERQRLAVLTTSLSRLKLVEARRLFPKQLFPRWIVFSKREKVHWINHVLIRVWPFLNQATCAFSKVWMESVLELYKPAVLAGLKFRKFTLGTIPPQISGVEIVESTDDEIVMEIDFQWAGNLSIILVVQTLVGVSLPLKIKSVNFAGVFRLIFKPLTEQIPCFQAFVYSLQELKSLDFELKLVGGKVSSLPGIHSLVEGWIKTAIRDSLLWPMRKVFKILPGDYRDLELKTTGILEVKLVQAKNLLNKDIIGKSDPFVILYIRPIPHRMQKSRTINNNLNPIWNQNFELEVEDVSTQTLYFRVLDEEGVQEPEFLGCAKVELKNLQPGKLTDLWIPLVKEFDMKYTDSMKYRGEVNLEICYIPLNEDVVTAAVTFQRKSTSMKLTSLERILSETEYAKKPPTIREISSPRSMRRVSIIRGILSLTVIRAEDLVARKSHKNPDPYVVLKVKKSAASMRTKVLSDTLLPEWNETFHMVIEDALHEIVIVEVWDHKTFRERFMGRCALTLTKLLEENDREVEMDLQGVHCGKIVLYLKWRNPSPSELHFLEE